MQTRKAGARILQLDTLRGTAVLLVFLHHCLKSYSNGMGDDPIFAEVIDFGRIGVVIFFLISGFVIARAIRTPTIEGIRLFWIHRLFRLYPAYWLALAVASVIAITKIPDISNMANHLHAQQIAANATMFQNLLGYNDAIGVFWTLQIEIIFYLMISAIYKVAYKNSHAYMAMAFFLFFSSLAYAAIMTVTHHAASLSEDKVFLGLLHLSIMFAGARTRQYWDSREGRQTGFIGSMPLDLKAFFAAILAFLAAYTILKARAGLDVHSVRALGSYSLAFVLFFGGLQYLGHSRTGKFFGDISYSFYLFHMPVLALCYYGMRQSGLAYLPEPLFVILTLAASTAVAFSSFKLVEVPCNRFAHRFRLAHRP
ncbi:acyltransferase [Sphingomonas sp. AP4-R1]|uniref:acyltransferase family protein n=1 Tax=Sphingomonas sp. AP4-R1 TaxID=2735134 RepID=UPI0014938746|nr:acyltransferase [Sphingomonas sp. AP4-R1]QJU58567.1 acyltransferase [Sphingomonas sp. AP4-R1]